MEVIHVSGSIDSFEFVRVDIPDEVPQGKMRLDMPHRDEGANLYCFTTLDIEFIKNRFGCSRVVSAGSKQAFEDILGRSNRILFESRYVDINDRRKPNKRLLNGLDRILGITAAQGRKMLILMQVTDSQYAWMRNEITRRVEQEEKSGEDVVADHEVPRDAERRPAHVNAWHAWIPLREELEEESHFAFKPRKVRYSSPYVRQDKWGGLYVHREEKVNRWIEPDGECRCLLCRSVNDQRMPEAQASMFSFRGRDYVVYKNPDGGVQDQWTIVHSQDPSSDAVTGYCSATLSVVDVQLMRQLACSGLGPVERLDYGEASPVAEWERILSTRFALHAHVDAAAKNPRHLAFHCVPMQSVPLPRWRAAPWEISGLEDVKGYTARAADLPFYAVLVTAADARHIDSALEKLHVRLCEEKQEYCILISPRTSRRRGCYEPVVAVVPLCRESGSHRHDDKGLEFLTGVCILGADENPEMMNPAVRDHRLRAGTLTIESDILKFERTLRDLFGIPPPGLAVVATDKGDHFSLAVENNTTLEGVNDQVWKSSRSLDTSEADEREDVEAAPLLVRVTRAGISNADRRHLGKRRRGSRKANTTRDDLVVCREGGGYIVDPGGYANAGFSSGRKVVLTPYRPCGDCDACRSFKPNLCSSLKLMGFDYHGCLRQLTAIRPSSILPVTSALDDDALPLVEPLACCIHALFRVKDYLSHLPMLSGMEDPALHPVTIYGAGPIGMLVAYAVRRFWPTVPVLLIDPLRQRHRLVERMKRSGLKVMSHMPDGHRSSLTIVTANSLDAYLSATVTIETGGIVIVYAGLNRDELEHDDRNRSARASFFQNIHQDESVHISGIAGGTNYTLMGSSGYINHDLRRAIHELEDHYDGYYSDLQTITINGIDARESWERPSMKRYPFARKAVQVYLAPEGTGNEDEESDRAIVSALKVLIRI